MPNTTEVEWRNELERGKRLVFTTSQRRNKKQLLGGVYHLVPSIPISSHIRDKKDLRKLIWGEEMWGKYLLPKKCISAFNLTQFHFYLPVHFPRVASVLAWERSEEVHVTQTNIIILYQLSECCARLYNNTSLLHRAGAQEAPVIRSPSKGVAEVAVTVRAWRSQI